MGVPLQPLSATRYNRVIVWIRRGTKVDRVSQWFPLASDLGKQAIGEVKGEGAARAARSTDGESRSGLTVFGLKCRCGLRFRERLLQAGEEIRDANT